MKAVRLILLLAVVLIFAASLNARPSGKAPPRPKDMSQKTLNANAWTIHTTNYGPFVNPQTASGGFWRNPAHGYIYGAGLWIGGILSSGYAAVSQGYDCAAGASELAPYPDSWIEDPMVRIYLSTDPTDLDVWPVVENGQKVIRSDQDSWCRYYDNPQYAISGDSCLYVMVEQFSYAWNYADNNDIVFFYFKVKNIGPKTLDRVYLGPAVDCDIGDESAPGANDRTAFDYTRNLAMQFQIEPEAGWDVVGVVGFRYFESPLNNTGNTVLVQDNQFPHSIAPNQPLGLTAFKILTLDLDPKTDEERYLEMSGINYWDLIPDAYDENGTDVPDDKRFIMSSGPFILKPDSVVTTCIGIIGALDTNALKVASDVAQVIYDNNFILAQPPAAPVLTVASGDGKAYLSWEKTAEITPDPLWSQLPDTFAWHYYFRGTWQYLPDSAKQLVDSFQIRTSPTTYARIARDAANPTGGTDTTFAFYRQKDLYQPYDFQGYLIYRADNIEDLDDPAKRCPVGSFYRSSLGAGGYFYDKNDGIQIVLDTRQNSYFTVDTTYYLPAYDTIGADRGLIHGLVDDGLINGRTYYYGISAYDYQPYAYFTRKCLASSTGDPRENARAVVPWKKPFGYVPPNVSVRVDGGSDARSGGALDYLDGLCVIIPDVVRRDSFELRWGPMAKYTSAGVNHPVYRGYLYGSSGALLDSLSLQAQHNITYTTYPYTEAEFYGTPHDQLPFGGLAFQPNLYYLNSQAVVDTVSVTGNYPADSIFAQAYGSLNTNFTPATCAWMWRGSDFEIRWRDSSGTVGTNPSGSILCAQVWDITNNVEVPLETGATKVNMTQASWCFNPAATAGVGYLDSLNATARLGMFISGINLYFNRRNGGTLRNISTLWSLRPHTGDVWTVHCSGPGTPSEGAVATFTTTPAVPDDGRPHLLQNYPNPFSLSGTNIFYQVSGAASDVNLRVYNIAGRLVQTLVNQRMSPGYYRAVWDGRDDHGGKVSSGIYFYRLQIAGTDLTKRMVLIK